MILKISAVSIAADVSVCATAFEANTTKRWKAIGKFLKNHLYHLCKSLKNKKAEEFYHISSIFGIMDIYRITLSANPDGQAKIFLEFYKKYF